MKLIKNKWRIISLGYLVLSYILLVVVLKNPPLSTFFIGVGIFFLSVDSDLPRDILRCYWFAYADSLEEGIFSTPYL